MTLVLTEPLPPYTCPIELLTFQPTTNDIKTVFKNGDYERKIYNNIELDEDERQAIAALRKLQTTAEIKLSRSMQCRILRFLSHTRNNEGKALQCLLLTQEWRKMQFRRPLVDTALRDKLRSGFSYFCGRDSGMRPMLFVRSKMAFATSKSLDVASVINLFTFCMEYAMRYLFIPGKVECLNVVIDVDGMTVLQYKDDRVRQLIHVLTKHYVGQLYKMFVINAPIWIGSIWSVFKSILSDRQRAKTVFVSKPSHVCSDAGCARHQIEERYGGSKPDLTEYYPFSFSPGPFTAGYDGIPNTNSPKDAHRCINRVTSVGMLAEDGAPKPPQWSSRGRDILMSLGMWAPESNNAALNRVSPSMWSQRSDFPDTDEETEFFSNENPLKQRGRGNDDTKNIRKKLKFIPSEESTMEGDEEKEDKATDKATDKKEKEDRATDNATDNGDAGPRTPSSPSTKPRINPMAPRQVTVVACCDAASPCVVTTPGHKRAKKVSIDCLSASTEITTGTKKSEEEIRKEGEEDEEEEPFSDNDNYAKSDDQESLLSELLEQEDGQEALERLRLAMLEKKPKSRTLVEVLAETFFSSWMPYCCYPSQKRTSVDVIEFELQVKSTAVRADSG